MRKQIVPLLGGLGAALLLALSLLSGFARGADGETMPRDRWSAEELDTLATLSLRRLPPAAADPSNAVEALPAAAELGRRLFNDARLSRNQAVSCASCHDAKRQFQDGLPLGRGLGTGARRTMPIADAGRAAWLFWDGRKDSLWSQALGPLEDQAEHGGNRTRYAHLLRAHYRGEYEAVFGALPALAHLPQDAGPLGTPAERSAWAGLDAKSRDEVSRVFANMGKAIAAYEKTLVHGEARIDRYVEATLAADASAQQVLTPREVDGLRLFIGKGQCITCHNGALFTDQQFHNTGVPPRQPAQPDRGRAAAIDKVQKDEFNCLGPFGDAAAGQCQELRFMVTDEAALEGAFKTPGLRNVASRAPYMHAGQLTSLGQVVAHYVAAPPAAVGHSELSRGPHSQRPPIRLSAREVDDLVAFLGTLEGPIVEASGRRPP
jgi:cytochrome c peroxidase